MMIGHLVYLEGTSAWVIRPGLARVSAFECVDLETLTSLFNLNISAASGGFVVLVR